ncbi:MAG: thioether cross-link-forming SCIFF peptide maturase [Caldisericota bacterium]|nr:thioether cross-link-forming SCIFF peptide maturase [Caldisericota bacterium]
MALSRNVPASVHLFERGGLFILLDVPSGSVYSVDPRVYRYLQVILREPQVTSLQCASQIGVEEDAIDEIEGELEQLIAAGCLFTPPVTPNEDTSGLTLKSLCLNVAHSCNFSCSYCFAHGGDYGGAAELMPERVARAAIDYLVGNSGSHRNVEVDFFGGEPLLDWPVVADAMAYARGTYPAKSWRFTLTTNGSLLRPDMMQVLDDYDVSLVLSLDGGKETNDRNRTFSNARGTFDAILDKIRAFSSRRAGGGYYVRGTYARNTLAFCRSVRDLHDLGFRYISMEPVVLSASSGLALTTEDLPAIRQQYEELIAYFVAEMRAGTGFDFFHFKLDLEAGPCVNKRIYGCGAGVEYMAVAPDGSLFPCHQFDGVSEFRLGNVLDTPCITAPAIVEAFAHANFLFAKESCRTCWARFYCSGGCLANNFALNHDLLKPYELGCSIQKERIEAALTVKVMESEPAASDGPTDSGGVLA